MIKSKEKCIVPDLERSYTKEELDSLNVEYPPYPVVYCPYCGQPLDSLAYFVLDRWWWVTQDSCDCLQSYNNKLIEEETKKEQIKKKSESNYLAAGIGKRYLEARISSDYVQKFFTNINYGNGIGFYVVGSVGSGKTYFACALAKLAIDLELRVIFDKSKNIISKIQQTFDNSQSAEDLISKYSLTDVLIIDDLCNECLTEWSASTLLQIIDNRYMNMKTTIYTSSYVYSGAIEKIEKKAGLEIAESIVSRIKETSVFVNLGSINRRIEQVN